MLLLRVKSDSCTLPPPREHDEGFVGGVQKTKVTNELTSCVKEVLRIWFYFFRLGQENRGLLGCLGVAENNHHKFRRVDLQRPISKLFGSRSRRRIRSEVYSHHRTLDQRENLLKWLAESHHRYYGLSFPAARTRQLFIRRFWRRIRETALHSLRHSPKDPLCVNKMCPLTEHSFESLNFRIPQLINAELSLRRRMLPL